MWGTQVVDNLSPYYLFVLPCWAGYRFLPGCRVVISLFLHTIPPIHTLYTGDFAYHVPALISISSDFMIL